MQHAVHPIPLDDQATPQWPVSMIYRGMCNISQGKLQIVRRENLATTEKYKYFAT